jgi:hypothetical protein
LGAIISVATRQERGPDYYQTLLGRFSALSHVTVEVQRQLVRRSANKQKLPRG